MEMNIALIGTGYVGLVTGACLAEIGHQVICVDNDSKKIEFLQGGGIPIYEPGLEVLAKSNVAGGRLNFTTDISVVSDADVVFIAVGTPTSRRGDGYADLTYVYEAAREVAMHLRGYTIVANKSTVPVGTAEQVSRVISEANPEAEFEVVSNPEFLREGAAINDFMRPDRVVVGTSTDRALAVMQRIYEPLSLREVPIVATTPRTAELIKYASNAFLSVKISFINEMAVICEATDADVKDLAKGMGLDGRIGQKFLHPGPGYGGSCFPKDTLALLRIAQEHGVQARIVEAGVEVNAAQKARMIKKIRDAVGGNEAGVTIAALGLTFKPDTDDLRFSPALTILPALMERGAKIRSFDPQGMSESAKILPEIHYCTDAYDACVGADVLVLFTEWLQFRSLDLEKIRSIMSRAIMVDLRNIYDPTAVRSLGFKYVCIGRS
jgi:UDPglucose 6-dehydrogenase